jgi:dimethylargininase
MFKKAITRIPARSFANGLTTSKLGKPDYELMLQKHFKYVETLVKLGLEVTQLEPFDDFPDAHFVEDVAVVTNEIAVITNPGAPERNGEKNFIKAPLSKFRDVEFIESPGNLEGGDVLQIDKHFFIGISDRTNKEGAIQLGSILSKYGYTFTTINVGPGLHLKSSVNYIGKNTLLITEHFFNNPIFDSYNKILVDKDEEYAANSLLINDTILTPKGFPKTKRKLTKLNPNMIELDMSEVQKMDGGLTCLSIRLAG